MSIVIALDAMGGDFGPPVVVKGADIALSLFQNNMRDHPLTDSVEFILFGDENKINQELQRFPKVAQISKVRHTDVVVTNDMRPIDALRHRKDSNLGMAIDSVESGETQAIVSAANTGAYVSLSKIIFGTLPGIDRPAIPAIMPNLNDRSIVLDLGANLECSSEQLTQFALMGEALARALFKKPSPSVGLLNVGAEEMKGNATVQATNRMLRMIDNKTQTGLSSEINAAHFNFHGFVEGNDIFKGAMDVVVTDGFSGNIALKSIEGVIAFFFELLKRASEQSIFSKLATLTVLPTLKRVKKTIDPRLYNGAVFLGLRKIAVKSHGGADAFSFAQAIKVAVSMVQANFIEDIEKRLQLLVEIQ